MAFINQDRTSSIQSDRLNLKQTPADIWEYDDAGTDTTPKVRLKETWELEAYVGIDKDETITGDKVFSGANTFTGATPQVASAWVNFNGTGTPAIRDDYNVDSITDRGTGLYTVNIDVDLDNANYAGVISCKTAGTSSRVFGAFLGGGTYSASACDLYILSEAASTPQDPLICNVIIMGGKA